MKKQHYALIATGLFLALFSIGSSCHKKKKYCPKGSGTCRSVLEAKDFFLFKQGTWWVYEEEHTHQRDSQYVYEYNNTSGYDFDMRVHSTLDDYNYHFWPKYAELAQDCSESEPVSGHCLFVKRNKGKTQDYVGEADCFFFNYSISDEIPTLGDVNFPNNKIKVVDIISYYSLGQFSFNNVVKMNEIKTLIEGNQPTNHYYVKNVGLIRKELLDSNQVWNLVNYHVEQ